MATCSIAGCLNRARSRGWCNKHYLRWFTHGDPTHTKIRERGDGSIITIKKNYSTKFIYVDCPFRKRRLQIREHIHVAEVHILNRRLRKGEVVHHKDGNPINNSVSNLEVKTRSAHIKDHLAEKNWLKRKGTAVHNARLNDEKVRLIRKMIAEGMTLVSIARHFGVKASTIKNVKRGMAWRHVV